MNSGVPLSAARSKAFDPRMTAAMGEAFDSAWKSLEDAGSEFATPSRAPGTRNALAQRIIELAADGEFDPVRLRDHALNRLSYTPEISPEIEAETMNSAVISAVENLDLADVYRKRAEECMQRLERTVDEIDRQRLIRTAASWLVMARTAIFKPPGYGGQ